MSIGHIELQKCCRTGIGIGDTEVKDRGGPELASVTLNEKAEVEPDLASVTFRGRAVVEPE